MARSDEGAPEVTLFKVPAALPPECGPGDHCEPEPEHGAFTGGINDFASEEARPADVNPVRLPAATSPASLAADEAVAAPLRTPTHAGMADEAGLADRPLWDEEAFNELVPDAVPQKPRRAAAPWRSPEELLGKAPAALTEPVQPIDDPLNAGEDTDDPAVSWDTAPVYPPSAADGSATDLQVSTATTPDQPSQRLWLGAVAVTFLLFAIGVSLLPPDGPRMDSTPEPAPSARAVPSLDPAAAAEPLEQSVGTAGVVPGAAERPGTGEAPAPLQGSTAANEPRSATPYSAAPYAQPPSSAPQPGSNVAGRPPANDRPVDAARASRDNAPAPTAARDSRSGTIDVAPPAAAPAPGRNTAPIAPALPAPADTVVRSDEPSRPAAPTSETTGSTPPPVSAGEARAVPPASTVDAPRDDRSGTGATGSGATGSPDRPPTTPFYRVEAIGETAAIEGITTALRRLQSAYEQRDATLAKAVWPTVNERALARAFDGLRSQSVTFERCWMNVFKVSADVECRGVTTYVPRVGSQDQRTESRQWTFRVQKDDDHWLITSAEAR